MMEGAEDGNERRGRRGKKRQEEVRSREKV